MFFTNFQLPAGCTIEDSKRFVTNSLNALKNSKKIVQPEEGFSLERTDAAEVRRFIGLLSASSSAGSSCISNRIIQACVAEITPILAKLFNFCIDNACQPDEWKFAFVHPLFKGKGVVNDRDNNRGVSVLPTIEKVFERIVATQITCYFENNSLFSDVQHGFRSQTFHSYEHLEEKY